MKYSAAFVFTALIIAVLYHNIPIAQKNFNKSMRKTILEEFRPVSLKNCEFKRYGGRTNGYNTCSNLLGEVESSYSYGIAGTDDWACDVTNQIPVPVHQYDCFDLTPALCKSKENQLFHFYPECLGGSNEIIDKRVYKTLEKHVSLNQDSQKKLLVKMDIEGSEWESLQAASDDLLQSIDQLSVEFHHPDKDLISKYFLLRRLKKHFYITNVHFNNYACDQDVKPFPAWAFQVHFVSKRLAVLDNETRPEAYNNPLDTPDHLILPDCQLDWNAFRN